MLHEGSVVCVFLLVQAFLYRAELFHTVTLYHGPRICSCNCITGNAGLSWVEGNAEVLPFEDNSMDAYTIAFGIRNVTDRPAALREAYRVLKRGGRFLCLEFSQVCGEHGGTCWLWEALHGMHVEACTSPCFMRNALCTDGLLDAL